MKISILINPQNKNSQAIENAFNFIEVALMNHQDIIQVFFYGYAVDFVFSQESQANKICQQIKKLQVFACSTIADEYISKGRQLIKDVKLSGLGQWMESIYQSDRYIEFS